MNEVAIVQTLTPFNIVLMKNHQEGIGFLAATKINSELFLSLQKIGYQLGSAISKNSVALKQ